MGEARRREQAILNWAARMAHRYGRTVDWAGSPLSWTAALACDCYGPNPDNWPENVTRAMARRAQEWDDGDWPAWATKPEGRIVTL